MNKMKTHSSFPIVQNYSSNNWNHSVTVNKLFGNSKFIFYICTMNKIGYKVKFESRKFRIIPFVNCTKCAFYDNGIDCTQHLVLSCVDEDIGDTTMMFEEINTFSYGK